MLPGGGEKKKDALGGVPFLQKSEREKQTGKIAFLTQPARRTTHIHIAFSQLKIQIHMIPSCAGKALSSEEKWVKIRGGYRWAQKLI